MEQRCPACDRSALVTRVFGETFARIICPIDEQLLESGELIALGCGRLEWPLNLPVRIGPERQERVSRGLREMQKDDRSFVRVSPGLLARLQETNSDQIAALNHM